MEQLITDLWTEFQGYYDDFVAFLPKLLVASLLFILFYLLAYRIRLFARRMLEDRMKDPLLANFLAGVIRGLVVVLAFLLVLKIVGWDGVAGGLLASAGVGAFIIGFAFRDIGENFLAGIMLAFQRPFKLGDLVEIEGIKGKVVNMTIRDTQVKTDEGIDVFIPNGNIIKSPLKNYTIDGDLRFDFTVGIDYSANLKEAVQIVMDTLKTIRGVMQDPRQPVVIVENLGASAVNLHVFYWIDAFDPSLSGADVKNKAVASVLAALDQAGIYMPADIMEVKNYRDLEIKSSV